MIRQSLNVGLLRSGLGSSAGVENWRAVGPSEAMAANATGRERLNLGCGPNAPANWLNVDGSWNAWLSNHRRVRWILNEIGLASWTNQGAQWTVAPLVHDLRNPLPFPDNSFSAVYGSHVLEHLYRCEAQALLRQCWRVLKPGGVLRLVVPDLRTMVLEYTKRKNDENLPPSERVSAADRLDERLGFRSPIPPQGHPLFKFYRVWTDFHSHKWMYDSDSLKHYFDAAGFREVSDKEFRQSEIPGIAEVEDPERVLGGAGICVEGKKP